MGVKQSLNGFDKIAWIYDFLAQLVFGKAIKEAQLHFLHHVPDKSSILILGGGTGWLLAELLRLKPRCCVWYIEASEKMIALTKARLASISQVCFIHGSEQHIPRNIVFDVVITPFYLDMFSTNALRIIMKHIQHVHKDNGLWLATDFADNGIIVQKVLLNLMYRFFRTITKIEATKLPLWQEIFDEHGYVVVRSQGFYRNFIRSVLYQKRKLMNKN